MIRGSASVYVFDNRSARPVARRADPPTAFTRRRRVYRLRGSISPSAVSSIASAIQTQEGWYPGSVSWQNNNPGNLVYAGQPGASPGAGGFARFQTLAQGQAALNNQITLDATRGADVNGVPINSLSDLITSWAPPSENNTSAYIQSVAAQTGYDPSAPLSSLGTGPLFLAPPASSIDLSNAGDSAAPDGSGFDLASVAGTVTSDLSSISPWMIGAGVAGLVLLSRLF